MKLKKQIAVYLAVMVFTYALYDFLITPYIGEVMAVTYRWGATGSTVTEIQTRLKRWGYYTGSVDGKYGYGTYTAVKKFQQKNGLTADGVAGDATLKALGINVAQKTTGTSTASNQNLTLLSRLINGEARGEPYQGQVAVGAVIMNRVRDPRFPNTVAGVIYQPGAFTAIVDGQINVKIEQSSINAARDALNGWDPSGGAVFYYNPAKTTNKWIWSRPVIKVIGSHRFCK
ncbi:spore cortex-lytic enzyme [Clostridium sp. 19966]|uniref:spore cortex-lytic enzyme n=1 Tax=Clostridium sp. 19966 TaxID=2768166 RepID=UPI0028DDAF0E|nr:spore cortex-lytic enzyme [Clostridium sp. 19966]MDT8718515.1 spore cortex-lytic enzyme [Clostridium sp. 19966]